MLPAWAQLLKQHRREGHFGLTLSFLVGAMREPPGARTDESNSIQEFRALLKSMRDDSVGSRVRIVKCLWLQQAVAALSDETGADEIPIPSGNAGGPFLFIAHKYLVGGAPEIETVFRNLWSSFQQPISEGRFSYVVDDESFRPFSEADLSFVERALRRDGS